MAQILPPPMPNDPAELARVTLTSRRVRILGGDWKQDARTFIAEHFARETLSALPPVSIDRNPLKNIVGQLATLYDVAPVVVSATGEPVDDVVTSGLVAVWPELLKFVIGLNEALIRVDAHPDGELVYRVVTPDNLRDVRADPLRPDRAVALSELRRVVNPLDGWAGWASEVWSVANPDAPVFRVMEHRAGGPVDATRAYFPDLELGGYPYRDLTGAPILPYVLYHLTPGRGLFSPREGEEMVEGTLALAMLSTCAKQGQRDLAYPQRVLVDGELVGVQAGADQARVVTSPLTILQVRSSGAQSAGITSWASSFDPVASVEALDKQEGALSGFAGLTPADMNLSAASSGAARVISKEGMRRARLLRGRAQEPSDRLLFATAARILNAARGAVVYPESPKSWAIVYQELAPVDATA